MEIETATEKSMQDISSDIEKALYPSEVEPVEKDDDVVVDDEATLPETDDTDSDDEDGSEDLEDIAEGDDLTLAEYLGIDEDKLLQDSEGNWVFNATIDGEEKQVGLKELTKSYQIQGHVNNKSIALENERKEFQEQQVQIATELKERVDGVDTMMQFLEKEVVAEFNGVDWERLRVEDPSNWAAMRQEYAEKAQRVQEMKSLAGQERARLQQEGEAQQQQAMSVHLQAEKDKMLLANPTWVDSELLNKDMGVLKDFVKTTYGFNDDDTKLVTDHRLIGLIQDAHKFRSGEKNRKSAESKKDVVVPKFQKSRATQAKSSQLAAARKVKAKRAAVKKSGGSVESVANLLIDRM